MRMDTQTRGAEFKVTSEMCIIISCLSALEKTPIEGRLCMLIPPSLPPVSSHSPLLYHISLTHSASLSFIRGVGRIRSVIDRLFLLQDACSCSHARALSTATDIDIRCVIVCVFAHFHLSSADLF